MIRILFVCHGNICRSTMCESIMTHLVNKKNQSTQISIQSAATHNDEIGSPPHYGTEGKLKQMKIPLVPHRAVRMTKADYDNYDYLIGMDSANIQNMKKIAGGDPDGKIHKLLSFAGSLRDIADPWYTGNFDETYSDALLGCQALLDHILQKNTSSRS